MTEADFNKQYGEKNLFFVKELPDILCVSLSQIYELIDDGTLEVIRDDKGKKRMPIRVYRASILKYLLPKGALNEN